MKNRWIRTIVAATAAATASIGLMVMLVGSTEGSILTIVYGFTACFLGSFVFLAALFQNLRA